MNSKSLISTLLVASIFAVPAPAQQIIDIPGAQWATDVTPDGQIVAGLTEDGGFIWRWRVDPTPTYITGGSVVAISDDGKVAVGDIVDPVLGVKVAGRWTAATGWQSLGYLPNALNCPSRSNSFDVSGDGNTVIGLSWDGCNGRGFRWTAATGMVELEVLSTGRNRATIISADGSTIGGFAEGNVSGRTPTEWSSDTTGEAYDLNSQGEVRGLNRDGSVSVGTTYFSGSLYTAFVRDSAGNMTDLGSLDSAWAGNAEDISEDGKTIAGNDYIGTARRAWIWTQADGIVTVDGRAAALGFPTNLDPLTASSISDDGNIVVGRHLLTNPTATGGYIFEFVTPLRSATNSISLSAGGSQNLEIDFRRDRAGHVYWIFGSATGTSPGLDFNGPLLPLNFDGYFNFTLTRPNAVIFGNFIGALDGQGRATASFSIPAASDPSLAGVVLNHAVTVSSTLGSIEATSNAVSVTLGS